MNEIVNSALASIGDGIIVTDIEGKIQFINESGTKLLDKTLDEIRNKVFDKVFELVNLHTKERLESPIWESIKYNRTVGLRNLSALKKYDDNYIFISANSSPVKNEEGKTIGAVIVFRNINRIKNIEEEILRERNNFKKILESLPIGIIVLNNKGNISWFNMVIAKILNISEIYDNRDVNKYLEVLINNQNYFYEKCRNDSEHREGSMSELVINCIENEKSYNNIIFKFEPENKKEIKWLKASVIPFNHFKEKEVIIAIDDITKQKMHEKLLEKGMAKAEAANKTMSDFLANMSHEIRTPLNGMMGMMELLLISGLSPDQIELVNMAKSSEKSLLNVINDILDFSKLENKKLLIEEINFDIKKRFEETVKINEVLAKSKGLNFKSYFSPQIPQYIIGDPYRVRQIITNLLNNAIKFTEEGEIRFIIQERFVSSNEVEIVFSIEDTGIGISPEEKEKLFDRFNQADGSNTRKYGGTGLGLSISKALIEGMGGKINIESEKGIGSKFYFSIKFKIGFEDSYMSIDKKPVIKFANDEYKDLKLEKEKEQGSLVQTHINELEICVKNQNWDEIEKLAYKIREWAIEHEKTILREQILRLELGVRKKNLKRVEKSLKYVLEEFKI